MVSLNNCKRLRSTFADLFTRTFIIAAICGVAGILVTYFFIPDLQGEDLAEEDEHFRAYLVSKGWDGQMGEKDLAALADEGIPANILETKSDKVA